MDVGLTTDADVYTALWVQRPAPMLERHRFFWHAWTLEAVGSANPKATQLMVNFFSAPSVSVRNLHR